MTNLENIKTIYHYSIPNVKLAYPEPFIASASFMHTDLWFMHILVYQYWLWFIFVFLIVFFFLNFICILRWCNMRIRPRRETRGVSRSKCADLITATVPVSWATSIIVSESTDAIDYYDGFGTTEFVVGIRAYQWGWEYYYPKDLDLNYNIKNNFSTFTGNSLKYTKTTDVNLKFNNLWKFYQNKNLDNVITPAHLIFLPIDNYKLLNFFNLNDVGSNPLHESTAFKKIKMISKTTNNNLINSFSDYNNKYKFISTIFINENHFSDSLYYGLKRQHDYLNNTALLNNNQTFLNFKSINTWLNFYINNDYNLFKTFNNNFLFNYFTLNFNTILNLNQNKLNNLFFNYNNFNSFFFNFQKNINILTFINNDSDDKKYHYLFFKLINLKNNSKNINFLNLNFINKINNWNEQSIFNDNLSYKLNNFNLFYKNFSTFSSNQTILTADKTLKNFTSITPNVSHYNLSSNLNTLQETFFLNKIFTNNNIYAYYNKTNSNWLSLDLFNKITSNYIYVEHPFPPINSNYPISNLINFDDFSQKYSENLPLILQGKEDQMPSNLLTIYWNMYFTNSNLKLRIDNNLILNSINNSFYLPLFTLYYDYDFRNWQSFELFEESYWESIFTTYLVDEYSNLKLEFDNKNDLYNKNIINFFNTNKDFKIKKKLILNDNTKNIIYANNIFIENYISQINLSNFSTNYMYNIFNIQNLLDDNYESNKFLNYLYNNNNKILIKNLSNYFNFYTYSFIFDLFRSDYEEFNWFFDDFNKNSIFFNIKSDDYNFFKNYNENPFIFNFINTNNINNSNRFSNYLNLRNSIKNSIVTYNAIQKIFRARFDEGRSNTKLLDFGNFYIKQPYLSTNRINYEKLLGKNKESFFKLNFYKNNFFSVFNKFYSSTSALNFYFFDFPFLLAMKSDASRYLWFDWFSRWGFYEVQPSSSSKYAIFGMPYFTKNFEFNTQISDSLNETENYFTRLSRARKNYIPNWIYTPFFYSKTNSWYKNNLFSHIFFNQLQTLNNTYYILFKMNWFWTNFFFINYNSNVFTPSNSNINSYSRGNWKPQASIQSYYYSLSSLIDILTKREYLYRQLLESTNKLINLPHYLSANPTNPLINDLKSAFLFLDPINYNNEYSRDIYYNSLNFFNFNIWKSLFNELNKSLNINFFNFFFFYFFNVKNDSINTNNELYKNQYRPLRKGIMNMIRLHATGAIAMPIEIRLQILASSKDVIHSWAIPSAGIKIDCIPGYSSHKVAIFLMSGIFWGQCMEICGRYHHWMPIVVYFMKRDLFFLWCTHFVFLSGSNNMWNINDRQFTNYIRFASFDKNSWITELN